MADTKESTITAPVIAAPAATSASSPTVETSAASQEAAASSMNAPADSAANTSVVSTEITSEPVKTEIKVETKTDVKEETQTPPATESILGDEKPAVTAKESDKAKPDTKADSKAEVKAETTKVELPTYEPFKLPENVSLDKEPLDAFSKILGEIEIGKLDHKGIQEAGQKLIDLAAKNTVDSINRLNDYYVGIHETQKKDWFEASKKDPELGNGDDKIFAEIANNLRSSIDTYAGTAEQQREFRTLMKDTGVGNHPALLRMLNNMQKKIDSYTKEKSNMAVPAQAPAPSKVKPYQTFYKGN